MKTAKEAVHEFLASHEGVTFTEPAFVHFVATREQELLSEHEALKEQVSTLEAKVESMLCEDCPPVGYPTDKTRCAPCPPPLPRPREEGP